MNVGIFVWKVFEFFKWYLFDFLKYNFFRECKYYFFKVDVYSFGMVCYEILCGSILFLNEMLMLCSVFYVKVKGGIRLELLEEFLKVVFGFFDYIKFCWDIDFCRCLDFVNICK